MVEATFKDHQRKTQDGGVRQRMPVLLDSRSLGASGKLADRRTAQRAAMPNNTGLPDKLKSGIESLSGLSMDNVNVHYNSSKPAQLNAHAYAQGTDIHLAPGQEKHLPHEAWHVVQQAQGRVRPTMQMKRGVPVNDDKGLEHEADVMGTKAATMGRSSANHSSPKQQNDATDLRPLQEKSIVPVQRAGGIEYETSIAVRYAPTYNPAILHSGWVDQDAVIATGVNWEIQSDNSKLEFVTSKLDMGNLGTTMNAMLNAIGHAQGVLRNTPAVVQLFLETLFPSAVITPNTYLVLSRNPMISGAPQGTIGIPFNKLYAFFNFLTKYHLASTRDAIKKHKARAKKTIVKKSHSLAGLSAHEKATLLGHVRSEESAGTKAISQHTSAMFSQISAVVDTHLPEMKHQETQRVKGLIHFIAQYAFDSSTVVVGYKKRRYAVMARSSFHSMFNGLSMHGQKVFKKKVFGILHALGLQDDLALFPNSAHPFTLKTWVDSIVDGVQVNIPTDNSLAAWNTVTSDLMTSPGVWSDNTPTDKSMGSMGLDADAQSDELVVVELRTLFHFASGQFGSFPVAAMRGMVNDLTNILNQTP